MTDVIERIRQAWRDNGTKLLGFGSVAIGALSALDHDTLQLIESEFGPHYGPHVMHALLIAGGVSVAMRGFANSKGK